MKKYTQMEKKTDSIFIVPGGIHSHIIPSFFIANRFRDTCTVYYLVETEALAKLVAAQGFTPILLKTAGIGFGAEYNYVIRKHKKEIIC